MAQGSTLKLFATNQAEIVGTIGVAKAARDKTPQTSFASKNTNRRTKIDIVVRVSIDSTFEVTRAVV